ncbi:MAG: hypothetical protein JNL01_03555 [Bdellovibrionales bacterium]|nr:hypothetical protein [Bdellovibrionales bacterium]
MKQGFLGLVLVLSLAGCGGDDGGSTGATGAASSSTRWACNTIASNNACIEYTGSEWNSVRKSNYTQVCRDHRPSAGTVESSCPGSWTGRCLVFEGQATEQYMTYYGPADIGTRRTSCESVSRGRWISP